MDGKPETKLWLIGLAMFGVVILMGVLLNANSEFGIVDHQIARTAIQVDTIQSDWRANGVRNLAIAAMIGDLIFIGFYGWGSYIAGRSFARLGSASLRLIGFAICTAAAIFLVTDYLETILQFVQLVREQGSDWMAGTAATVQPIKVYAWVATFIGILLALVIARFSSSKT